MAGDRASQTILYDWSPAELRLALLEGGRPIEFAVVRPGHALGGIWLGRVIGVQRGLAFVDIGLDRPGVLQGAAKTSEGQAVLVQATADPQGEKGARLTTAISLAGPRLVLTPTRPGVAVSRRIADPARRQALAETGAALAGEGEGLTLRSAAADAGRDELAVELEALRDDWTRVRTAREDARPPACLLPPDPLGRMLADNPRVQRVVVGDAAAFADLRPRWPGLVTRHAGGPVFELDGAEDAFAAALAPEVPLPSGGRLIIETTAAVTAIDVDSGAGAPSAANAEAVGEAARQIRLRNLSGHLVLDLVPVRGQDPRELLRRLRRAVADDPVATHVTGTTSLGMVELTRERRRAPLAELMLERRAAPRPEALAAAALRALLRAPPGPGRPTIAAAPEVIAALRRWPAALAETARRLGQEPLLLAEPRRREDDVEAGWRPPATERTR